MLCFGNNTFLKSNEKVQHVTQIGIQESISCFANNVAISKNNLVGPLSINVGPSFPFHPSYFLFFHSVQVAPRMQKIDSSTQTLIFDKMRGGVNKEEVERLAQLDKDRQKFVVE